jgi:hypothetical protein
MAAAPALMPTELGPIKQRLLEAIKDHNTATDSWCFNGGTVLTLLLTTVASLLSSGTLGNHASIGAVLSAAAGVLVAMERALSFGARWRFHAEMKNGYRSIIDMIDFAPLLPEGDEKKKYITDIWTKLYALRSREALLPGTGTSSQVEH